MRTATALASFQGLMRRLDYLHGLGITAIWLMPFQTSPGKDDGYDISDYYGVNSAYGTLGDFVEFTHAAKQRGIRVLIDLVVNHTSNEHLWFQEARRDPQSQYRDWYIWSKKRPPDADKGMVFPGVQKSTWSRDPVAKQWYFHRFYDFQPDLNTSNPAVQSEILKIMGFWIQLGVSGFRMDAVPFIISTKGPDVETPREQYDMLRSFREFLQWRVGDSIILAEANVLPHTDMHYFGDDGDRMQMMFNFQVNQHLFYALASSDTRPLARAMRKTEQHPESAQWGIFLRNHDELDLGRLSEKQRQTVFDAFGPNKEDRTRRRLVQAANVRAVCRVPPSCLRNGGATLPLVDRIGLQAFTSRGGARHAQISRTGNHSRGRHHPRGCCGTEFRRDGGSQRTTQPQRNRDGGKVADCRHQGRK
jgi:maltose alpha-D-glucosyltransferase/alpha-amylase